MRHVVFVLLLLASSASAQPGGFPSSPPPTILILSKVDKEKQIVSFAATVTVNVPVVVRQKVIMNGMEVEVEKVQYVSETRVNETPIDLKPATFYNAKGDKRTLEQAFEAMRAGSAIVLSSTNGMIDPRYAAVLREDALILAHPLAGALTFGNRAVPPPPLVPPPSTLPPPMPK